MGDSDRQAATAATRAVALADLMRRDGITVSPDQVVAGTQAIALAGEVTGRRYWAGRVALANSPAGIAAYDAAFHHLEAGLGRRDHDGPPLTMPVSAASDRGQPDPSVGHGEAMLAGAQASAVDRLRQRRFDEASDEELAAITRAVHQLALDLPWRRGRRLRRHRRGAIDARATLAAATRTDGEIVRLMRQRRHPRPVPVVVVLDVSGSMAALARILLHLAVAWRRAASRHPGARVEVFAFATRLARLSPALGARDVDVAIAEAANRVATWDAGTTIGTCLHELVHAWGPRGTLAGARVVIVSDGLDRGDPATLRHAMRRLAASSRHVTWANPLAGGPDFSPIQRGMAAALPYVDRVVELHDLASLEAMVVAVGSPSRRRATRPTIETARPGRPTSR